MKKYIRFEIEDHKPWARNHLVGIYLDTKGNEKKDRLMCFNSCIPKEDNNDNVARLVGFFNAFVKNNWF